MTNKNAENSGCCSPGSGCCSVQPEVAAEEAGKRVEIDFLYLDLSVCTRCQGADQSLDQALSEVSQALKAAGAEVVVNKINVNTEELAEKHRFVSSPTIRVNGRDIQMEVKESTCESCGDLCGEDVDCRVWVYRGRDYTVLPKELIVDAILREVYGGNEKRPPEGRYVVPENLKRFYAARSKMKSRTRRRKSRAGKGSRHCCSSRDSDSRCC